jgi:hypothetical protein
MRAHPHLDNSNMTLSPGGSQANCRRCCWLLQKKEYANLLQKQVPLKKEKNSHNKHDQEN